MAAFTSKNLKFINDVQLIIISVVDFCDKNPSPCQNGGMCQSDLQNNWYSCVCSQGYHGKTPLQS